MALSIKELIDKHPPPWHVRMSGEVIQSKTGVWVCEAGACATHIVELANLLGERNSALDEVVQALLSEKPFAFDPATNFAHQIDGGEPERAIKYKPSE